MTELTITELEQWLVSLTAERCGIEADEIDVDRPLAEYGFSSRDAVELTGRLEDLLDKVVPSTLVWQHPTIEAIAGSLLAATAPEPVTLESPRAHPRSREPIAVIGIGCRLPGDVAGPDALWDLLEHERDAVGSLPAGRWSQPRSEAEAQVLERTSRSGGFLGDIAGFDAAFFAISPGEAQRMDPQQRMVLEVAWEALEHAAIAPESLRGSSTGAFVGVCASEYGHRSLSELDSVDAWSGTGGALSLTANRLSYAFDLRGPSVAVDTACSSSLVAVHLGIQSLERGESDLVLAAGANLLLEPAVTAAFHEMGVISPSGRCRSFSAEADGIVRAEGVGVVVLKRLSDAQAAGDRILAVLTGSATNQDGRSNGLTAPNVDAQVELLRQAYTSAGIDPREVDYVEAHGTGTLLGDPIEARALGTVLGAGREGSRPLSIGSAKSNFGHLEAAAGIIGLVKVVLALDHGRIPATLHYVEDHPHVDFGALGLEVAARTTEWRAGHRPRRAGVSSFGFGGTNAHVIVEQPPTVTHEGATEPSAGESGQGRTGQELGRFLLAAPDESRLRERADQLVAWLEGPGREARLRDVEHTLARRCSGRVRAAVVTRERAELTAGLRACAAGGRSPNLVEGRAGALVAPPVWVFSGQGSQWAGMGVRLLAEEPAFAAALDELDAAIEREAGFSVCDELAAAHELSAMERLQPVLFAVQVGLARLLLSYGQRPAAIIGHSLGEIAAAVVSGGLSLEDGVRVVVQRSQLLATLTGTGAMALVELTPDELQQHLGSFPSVEIASYNAPTQLTVAGSPEEIAALAATVEERGRLAKRVKVVIAGHCRLIEPIVAPLTAALAGLDPRRSETRVYPTALEDPRAVPSFDAGYWAANIRRPVRFAQAVGAAVSEGHSAFVEVSPHAVLRHALLDSARAAGATRPLAFSTGRRGEDETAHFHGQLAALALHAEQQPSAGAGASGRARADGGQAARLVDLPPIRWRHVQHWLQPKRPHARVGGDPLLGERIEVPGSADQHWQLELAPVATREADSRWASLDAWLAIMRGAAQELRARERELVIRGLVLHEPRAVGDRCTLSTRFRRTGIAGGEVSVHSRSGRGPWRLHASASVSAVPAKRAGTQATSGKSGSAPAPGDWVELVPAAAGERAIERALLALRKTPDGDQQSFVSAVSEIRWRGDGLRVRGVNWRQVARVELPVALPDKLLRHAWQVASALPSVNVGGRWLVIAEPGDPQADELALSLRDRGALVTTVGPGDAERELSAQTPHDEVAFLVPPGRDIDDPAACAAHGEALLLQAVAIVQALGEHSGTGQRPPRLQLVTRDAAAVGASDRPDPAAGALRGLVRVLAYEHPELRARWIDLDHASGIERLVSELAATDGEDEVAWRSGRRHVARLSGPDPQALITDAPAIVRRDGAYLVSGGLGGLGLVLVRWLAERGAARVVLLGRSAPSADAEHELSQARALGTEVVVVRGDIAEQEAVERAVAALCAGGARPSGVIHAAAAFEDRAVAGLDADSVRRVWSAKSLGAARLSAATAELPLDWWVGFSSAAALIGSPGQAAYATANAFLDALCARRRAYGAAATTINWGTWSQVGRAAQRTVDAVRPLDPDEGIAALEALLASDLPDAGVLKLDPQALLDTFPGIAEIRLFDGIVAVTERSESVSDWQGIDGLDPVAARERVTARVGAAIAGVLGVEPDALDRELPLPALGVDSLLAMRIRNVVLHDFERSLPPALMLRGACIDDVAQWLCEALGLGAAGLGPTPADRPVGVAPRDASERLVAAVWKLLERPEVGVTEPLWHGAGDQDLLAAAAQLLSQRSARPITVEQLRGASTIERQASLLREAEPLSGSPLRALAAGDGSQTLFLFHPGGGDTLVYRQLVEQLDPTLTVWGLDRLRQHLSVEERAARYLELVRAKQPSGPYQLAGWSFGGALAYETARQLERAGEAVETVAMIDTILPLPDPPGSTEIEILEQRFRRFQQFLERSYGSSMTLPYAQMARLGDEQQADLLVEAILQHGLIDADTGAAIIEHQRTSYLDVRASERYRPEAIAARVVLFSALELQPDRIRDPRFDRDDPARGWDAVYGSRLEIVPVPGHHLSLLDPPHVDVLAGHLRRLLLPGPVEAAA
jgi:phthiocerol/phenolphthiocerol synthesis type-I polyketide synthase D